MAGNQEDALPIAIDLGTKYCSAAAIWDGLPETILKDKPFSVAFTSSGTLFLDDAKNQSPMNPRNTIFDIMRLMGKKFGDDSVQRELKQWPFTVVEGNDGMPKYTVMLNGGRKEYSPEEITCMLLEEIKKLVECSLDCTMKKVVIAVPANFTESQLETTRKAAETAGLEVLCLLSAPVAAALARPYRMDIDETNVLIFDFGGCMCDVSLVGIRRDTYTVKATARDADLGGEDFDNTMVTYFSQEFVMRYDRDISQDLTAVRRLEAECEKAKRALSSDTETEISLKRLYSGIDFKAKITRAKFEELNKALFQRCMDTVKKCLKDAKMDKASVDEVIPVGGSSQIPKVQKMLQEFFNGKKLCKSINPDEAIAWGAALKARSILRGELPEIPEKLYIKLEVLWL